MEAILYALGVILVVWLLLQIGHRHRGNDDEESGSQEGNESTYSSSDVEQSEVKVQTRNMSNNKYEGMDVPTLIKALLKELNCQYQESEDGSLLFTYQSERFWLQSDKESSWIRITDLQWYNCPLDKYEEISCMQKAINAVNASQQCTTVYSIDKKENKMTVYSKCDLLITSEFPAPVEYLAAWLSSFFRLKQAIIMEFEKEKQNAGL